MDTSNTVPPDLAHAPKSTLAEMARKTLSDACLTLLAGENGLVSREKAAAQGLNELRLAEVAAIVSIATNLETLTISLGSLHDIVQAFRNEYRGS